MNDGTHVKLDNPLECPTQEPSHLLKRDHGVYGSSGRNKIQHQLGGNGVLRFEAQHGEVGLSNGKRPATLEMA
jgi:hypothetical protein